ncbi:MAG TPA: CPBP family intramembrane glutamic endopeptidase [Thermoanaerobaculia bacterium]|jgi:membrane protease YdiL (CAAX protease family)
MKRSFVILAVYAAATFMQAVLLRLGAYRELYSAFPFYVPELIKALVGVGICAVTGVILYREADLFRLRRGLLRAVAFGFVAASPMLVGFAVTRSIHVPDVAATVFLSAIFPFAEELIARGFAFGLLYWREKWPLWAAVTAVAAVTGASHIEKGQTVLQILGLFAVTGLGGLVFSWLLARWGSLWFPFAFHALMNLWWNIFSVAETALGGWYPFALQLGSVLLAVAVTVRLKPKTKGVSQGSVTGDEEQGGMMRVRLVAPTM